MPRWALAFLILAIAAAVAGFGLLAGFAALLARVLLFLFAGAFVVSLLIAFKRRDTRLSR